MSFIFSSLDLFFKDAAVNLENPCGHYDTKTQETYILEASHRDLDKVQSLMTLDFS